MLTPRLLGIKVSEQMKQIPEYRVEEYSAELDKWLIHSRCNSMSRARTIMRALERDGKLARVLHRDRSPE